MDHTDVCAVEHTVIFFVIIIHCLIKDFAFEQEPSIQQNAPKSCGWDLTSFDRPNKTLDVPVPRKNAVFCPAKKW